MLNFFKIITSRLWYYIKYLIIFLIQNIKIDDFKDILKIVYVLSLKVIEGEMKRKIAFNTLKKYFEKNGKTYKDHILNLLIEQTTSLIKNELFDNKKLNKKYKKFDLFIEYVTNNLEDINNLNDLKNIKAILLKNTLKLTDLQIIKYRNLAQSYIESLNETTNN